MNKSTYICLELYNVLIQKVYKCYLKMFTNVFVTTNNNGNNFF